MLVLTRKENERIFIDGKIIITVCRISKDKVRIGIEAPKDITIEREEIRGQS
jgi:carbon storage regulator